MTQLETEQGILVGNSIGERNVIFTKSLAEEMTSLVSKLQAEIS